MVNTGKGKMSVPCGKCDACLSNKRKEWYVRCWYELKEAQNAWFVTLTYDDEHLVWSDGIPTLSKVDVQLFIKRLRKSLGTKLKYYAVGEYGEHFERPHYHILFFNLLNDLAATQKLLEEAWKVKSPTGEKVPIGLIHVGVVEPASINYCLKYIIQDYKDDLNREKPFSLMSKRPPIGSYYFESEKLVKWHKNDINRSFCMIEGVKYPMPRIYREKIYDGGERQFQTTKATDRYIKKKCELMAADAEGHPRLERDRVEKFRASVNKSRKNKGRL